MPTLTFEVDQVYTFEDIRRQTGAGTTQSYLLSNGKKIVAGLFDPEQNPQAPNLIYPGPGPIIMSSAERVVLQRTPIPVFLKSEGGWQYKGMYLAVALSREAHHIASATQKAPNRKVAVAGVIRFDPAEEA